MPQKERTQRQVHYDLHSRQLPMENCSDQACSRAARQEAKKEKEGK